MDVAERSSLLPVEGTDEEEMAQLQDSGVEEHRTWFGIDVSGSNGEDLAV